MGGSRRRCQRLSPEHDFRIIVRRERLINRARLHVYAATRAVEKTSNREQSILRATGHKIKRRTSTEDNGVVRVPQPLDAESLRRKQNPKSLMDTQHRGDAGENIDIEGEGAMLTGLLAPVVIGGTRGIAEHQETLLLRQSPQVRDGQKRPQSGGLSRRRLAGAKREVSSR